jgi:hypothetical protein
MADPRTAELVVIFAVASLASLVAWELDREVLSALFAAAEGVACAMSPRNEAQDRRRYRRRSADMD